MSCIQNLELNRVEVQSGLSGWRGRWLNHGAEQAPLSAPRVQSTRGVDHTSTDCLQASAAVIIVFLINKRVVGYNIGLTTPREEVQSCRLGSTLNFTCGNQTR